MTTSEERMRVLRLIEEGKISAEEGARLLRALDKSGAGSKKGKARQSAPDSGGRRMRLRVVDGATGKTRVDMTIPLGLVSMGLAVGARFVPDVADLDIGHLQDALRSGASGKILEVVDEEGEVVEIFVE